MPPTNNGNSLLADAMFSPRTMVSTPVGERRADRVRVGDDVWAWDASSDRRVIRKVRAIVRGKTDRLYRIEAGGREIDCATRELQLWDDQAEIWRRLDAIEPSGIFVGASARNGYAQALLHEVARLPVTHPVDVLALIVDDADGLFANGLIISAAREINLAQEDDIPDDTGEVVDRSFLSERLGQNTDQHGTVQAPNTGPVKTPTPLPK